MRTSRKLGVILAAAATAAGVVAGPAVAADPIHPIVYLSVAGGSKVQALDGTVVSDLTAQSGLQGYIVPNSTSNDIAQAHVGELVSTGEITTDNTATAFGGGDKLVSHARTVGLNLLNGLITADAVDTTGTATFDGSADLEASTTTQFLNLKITNVDVPVNIPSNFTVRIPGVARIVLNYTTTYSHDGQVATLGAGIYITLLGNVAGGALGTRVFLNPTYAAISAHVPHSPVILGGSVYGSRVNVKVGDLLGVDSGRTALQVLGAGGTGGDTIRNSTARVNLPDILVAGAVETTIQGRHTNKTGYVHNTSKIAGVNLFDGLITARAIKSSTELTLDKTGNITINNVVTLLGLTIAGHHIPVTVSPNTTIDVVGLGTVTLNQQFGTGFATNVRAVNIKLDTARAGLPVGASIELAFASGYIIS
jgi:hypothetical protein